MLCIGPIDNRLAFSMMPCKGHLSFSITEISACKGKRFPKISNNNMAMWLNHFMISYQKEMI